MEFLLKNQKNSIMGGKIIYDKYIICQSDHAPTRFDLYETVTRSKTEISEEGKRKSLDETYEAENVLGYGMTLPAVINKIVHIEVLSNDVTLTLKEFVDQYKEALLKVEKAIYNQPQEA